MFDTVWVKKCIFEDVTKMNFLYVTGSYKLYLVNQSSFSFKQGVGGRFLVQPKVTEFQMWKNLALNTVLDIMHDFDLCLRLTIKKISIRVNIWKKTLYVNKYRKHILGKI